MARTVDDRAEAADTEVALQEPTPASAEALPDTTVLERIAADSAQDAAALELLHDVESPDSVPEPEFDLASGFDINVARYADHPRVQYYLDYFQGPARKRVAIWLERLPRYEPMIRAELAANNLPGDLVYLALIESGYSNTAVSRARAVGMWQFMRATGKMYGLRIDSWVDERRDPIAATKAATRYLADLTGQLGSHYLAAAAYNGGPGRVMRGLRRLGDPPAVDDASLDEPLDEFAQGDDQFFRLSSTGYLRRETKDYVPKLIAAAMIAKQPEKYGFDPIPATDPFAVDSVPVTEPVSLEVVAKVSDTPLQELMAINAHFVRGITPPSSLTWVRVPVGKAVAATEALAALPETERVPYVFHTVRRGETLGRIGQRYGVGASVIADANGGISSRRLRIGMTLKIPGGKARMAAVEASDRREARSSNGYHTVRRGETLGGIAGRYRVSLGALREWNGLGASNLIRAGQRLRVTARVANDSRSSSSGTKSSASTHLVRRGETLSGIASRYGVSIQSLMQANGLRSARSLQAGARIKIPS
ncbi:MAG: LysM peptidoglycan-binding domain-containing protein [Gemmatimonadales bacterium]